MNIKDIKFEDFKVNAPYPEIHVSFIEKGTLDRIIDSYAGVKGEWTAVAQYIYQSFITNPDKDTKYLAHLLMEVSESEMRHISILSQLLLNMDVDPKYCRYIDNNPCMPEPWSTRTVKYIKDIKEFIEYNITLEEAAIREYTEIVNMTKDPNIKDVINRIIKDEKSHLALFNTILKVIC